MKVFDTLEIDQALAHSAAGGQALHLHTIVFNDSPQCFRSAVKRGEPIAHLFDMDRERLIRTAKRLGVRVVYVDRDNTPRMHIDLCGKPLLAAYKLLDAGEDVKLEPILARIRASREEAA